MLFGSGEQGHERRNVMKKSDYIGTVMEQVRCRSVHKALEKELEAHIDDCAEAFAAEGLSPEEAEEKAVLTMGDPVETGIRLDRVHRPKFPWTIAASALLLLTAAMLAEHFLRAHFGFRAFIENDFGINIFLGAAIAIVSAAVFCLADYTVFLKAPKVIYAVCLIVFAVLLHYHIHFTDISHEIIRGNVFFCTMLFVPLTCGFAFSMRGGGFGKFALTCILTAVPTMLIAMYAPCTSAAVMAGLTALAVMTALVHQGSFKVNKLAAYSFMYLPAVLGAVGLAALEFRERTQIPYEFRQLDRTIMDVILPNSDFIGSGGHMEMNNYPWYHDYNHIITAVFSDFGTAAGVALVLLALSLPVVMLIGMHRVKNRFGKTIGTAIALVFLYASVTVILSNMGITTGFESYTAMPLTAGNALNCAVSGALVGVFMSVCRRSDIMPEAHIESRRESV